MIRSSTGGVSWVQKAVSIAAALISAVCLAQTPKVGDDAPDFTLNSVSGEPIRLMDVISQSQVVVLEWINPECPFVKKHYRPGDSALPALENRMKTRGVRWIRVNSAAVGEQGAGIGVNRAFASEHGIASPIALDPDAIASGAYGVARTPEVVVIDADGRIRYRGAVDNDRRASRPGSRSFITEAIEAVLAGRAPEMVLTEPYGCTIKRGG